MELIAIVYSETSCVLARVITKKTIAFAEDMKCKEPTIIYKYDNNNDSTSNGIVSYVKT